METLTLGKFYPIHESAYYAITGKGKPSKPSSVRARATGEYRKPKRGEFFLSGAIIEAYYAENDGLNSEHIAELVRP